jgi:hypothetical protein
MADQRLIDGISRNEDTFPPKVLVRSRAMTPEDLVAMFEGRIAAAKEVQRATAARAAAVKADLDLHESTRADVTALRGILVRSFAESPDKLAEFGLRPPPPPKRTAAEKADAAKKALATRHGAAPTSG